MIRLLAVRHAKSSRDDPSLADRDRPLAPRGERAAAAVAVYLAQLARLPPSPQAPQSGGEGLRPERVLCSPALRTRRTAELLLERMEPRPTLEVDEALYLADGRQLAARLAHLDDSVRTAMLVAHNPGLEELVSWLDPDAGPVRLPTAAVAVLELRVDAWAHLARGAAALQRITVPKDLV